MMTPDPRDHRVRALEAIVEAMVQHLPEHPKALKMQAEIRRLAKGAEALDRVNRSRSPLDTPAAHTKKVATLARTFDSEITATMNRAVGIWREGWGDAQRRIEEKVNLVPDAFAQEIRATFRSLGPKARANLLKDLVDNNRGPELAALVKAPSILSGMTDTMREQFEKAILAKHAPAELEEQAKLEEVLQTVSSATRAAGELAKALTSPAEVARIESGEAAANAASQAFNTTISSQ